MPCPHCKITIIKRSENESAVSAAAYQSGERTPLKQLKNNGTPSLPGGSCLLFQGKSRRNSMQSIHQMVRHLKGWIADLKEKKVVLLESLEQANKSTLPELLFQYLELRSGERADWTSREKLKGTVAVLLCLVFSCARATNQADVLASIWQLPRQRQLWRTTAYGE